MAVIVDTKEFKKAFNAVCKAVDHNKNVSRIMLKYVRLEYNCMRGKIRVTACDNFRLYESEVVCLNNDIAKEESFIAYVEPFDIKTKCDRLWINLNKDKKEITITDIDITNDMYSKSMQYYTHEDFYGDGLYDNFINRVKNNENATTYRFNKKFIKEALDGIDGDIYIKMNANNKEAMLIVDGADMNNIRIVCPIYCDKTL